MSNNTQTANRKKIIIKLVSNTGGWGGGWGGGGWLYSLASFEGVCRPVLQILTLFETKTCHTKTCHTFADLTSKIHTSFKTWRRTVTKRNIHVYEDRNYLIITEMTTPTKKYFLKPISNSHIMGLYVIHLELIDKYVHTPPWLPRKLYPIPEQIGQII